MDQDSWRWKVARFFETWRNAGLIIVVIVAVLIYAFTEIGPKYRPLDFAASVDVTRICMLGAGGQALPLTNDAMAFGMGKTSQVGSIIYDSQLPDVDKAIKTLEAAGNKIERADHAMLFIGPEAKDEDIAKVRRCTQTIRRDPITSLMAFDITHTTHPFAV